MKINKTKTYAMLRASMLVILAMVSGTLLLTSCEDESLPEAGSLPDLTPPTAAFSYSETVDGYLVLSFANFSTSATDYLWDFGDGTTSTEEEPIHTYAGDGTYQVSLIASDRLDASSTTGLEIILEKPFKPNPVIRNPGFENHPIRDDNREEWRNNALESSADALWGNGSWVLQTSSSGSNNTTVGGSNSGKLPASPGADPLSSRRWIYQAINVVPDTDYRISWSMKCETATDIYPSIYDGTFDDAAVIGDVTRILHTETLTTNADGEHARFSFVFNTSDRTEIVLFITNNFDGAGTSDTWFDDFEIEFSE